MCMHHHTHSHLPTLTHASVYTHMFKYAYMHMLIHTCLHMHTHTVIHACMCAYTCIHTLHIYIFTKIHTHELSSTYTCLYTCIHMQTHAPCTHTCPMYTYPQTHLGTRTYISIHTQAHSCTFPVIYAYRYRPSSDSYPCALRALMCTCANMHTRAYATHRYSYTQVHICIHMHSHRLPFTLVHVQTCMHTCACTHKH